MVATLAERGPVSVSELAAPLAIGLPTVLKHVRVLEDSRLVTTHKAGRVRTCRLRQERLAAAERWLVDRRAAVGEQLDAFVRHVESIAREPLEEEHR